jgi:xanthine dehydrogenase YagT iron-sulfur-binding subunit
VSSTKDSEQPRKGSGFSRRGFLQGVGIGGSAIGSGVLTPEAEAQTASANVISGETPITLTINGKPYKATVEPRMTLLDAMRHNLDLTAAKRVCDRGTCGACTVIMDGKAVYACTVLAIDAQGHKIQTLEGIANGRTRHPLVDAFVNNDAQQCGYCTPGFVMAAKALLDKNPSPTYDQVKSDLGGNLCRCGTYVGVRKAVLEAAGKVKGGARNA